MCTYYFCLLWKLMSRSRQKWHFNSCVFVDGSGKGRNKVFHAKELIAAIWSFPHWCDERRGKHWLALYRRDSIKNMSWGIHGAASGTNHRHILRRFWCFCLKAQLPHHRTVTAWTYCWQELPGTLTSSLTQESDRGLETLSDMTPLILFSAGTQILFHLSPLS